MVELVAFITGAVKLFATGAGAFAAASFAYGGGLWLSGDRERARSHVIHALWGTGMVLAAVALGVAVAKLSAGTP